MNKAVSTLFRSNGNRDVAITLLGFAGAKESHIHKYAQIYRDRGYDTIHFTSLLPTVYNMKLKNTREVDSVVDHLNEVLTEKEIAIHSFSMNGIFTLCSIELQHPELNFLKKTRGIFFDSGPVDLGFREVLPTMAYVDRYYKDILEKGDEELIKKYRKQKRTQFFKLIQHYSILPLRRICKKNVNDISAYDFLLNHPDLPQVMSFAYSKADSICNHKYVLMPPFSNIIFMSITKFAEFHQSRGRLIESLCLNDSPHVDHYRNSPEQYLQLIDSFLNNLKPRHIDK